MCWICVTKSSSHTFSMSTLTILWGKFFKSQGWLVVNFTSLASHTVPGYTSFLNCFQHLQSHRTRGKTKSPKYRLTFRQNCCESFNLGGALLARHRPQMWHQRNLLCGGFSFGKEKSCAHCIFSLAFPYTLLQKLLTFIKSWRPTLKGRLFFMQVEPPMQCLGDPASLQGILSLIVEAKQVETMGARD